MEVRKKILFFLLKKLLWHSGVTIVVPRIVECTIASESMIFMSKHSGILVTPTVMLANAIVHILWKIAIEGNYHEIGNWMVKNFIMPHNKQQLLRFQPHTMLLSAFSHTAYEHLAANMSMLKLVGPPIEKAIGTREYMYFYITSAYASHIFSLWIFEPFERVFKRVLFGHATVSEASSLGVSGAISSLFMYYCLRFPNKTLALGDEWPVQIPAKFAGLIYAFADLVLGTFGLDTRVGHGAHLGGYVYGFAYYHVRQFLRRHRRHRRLQNEKKKQSRKSNRFSRRCLSSARVMKYKSD